MGKIDADQGAGSPGRGMNPSQGCVLVNGCPSIETHRNFEKKLFLDPYGVKDNANEYPIRLILSSFYW